MKHLIPILALAAVIPLSGCGTIAERLADALEPHLERMVDKQIEREEKAAGVWGSYFWVEAEAAKAEEAAQEEAQKEEVLSAVVELISKNQETLLSEAEKLVEKKLKRK